MTYVIRPARNPARKAWDTLVSYRPKGTPVKMWHTFMDYH